MWFLFFIKRRNKNNRITHSTLKRKIDIQTTKIRTENKISKQKMIMSANKNNHNRSACKIFMSKNNPSKMQACFFKARKSRFCYRLSPQSNPKKFCWKLAPKIDPPILLHWSQTLSEIEFEIPCLPPKKLGDLKDKPFGLLSLLKLRYSEKDTKIWKDLPIYLTLLFSNFCSFFQNIWTL